MPLKNHAISLSVIFVLGVGLLAAHAQEKGSKIEWKANPDLVKKLGEPSEVEGYLIKAPKGYELQDVPSTSVMKVTAWGGPQRKDKTRPSLMFNVLKLPPAEQEKIGAMTLEQLQERLMRTLKGRKTNWEQDKPETGKINGVEFIRVHWSGTDTNFKREMRGFSYIAKDGKSILQITSQDFVPDGTAALSLAEAAVLTFQKK